LAKVQRLIAAWSPLGGWANAFAARPKGTAATASQPVSAHAGVFMRRLLRILPASASYCNNVTRLLHRARLSMVFFQSRTFRSGLTQINALWPLTPAFVIPGPAWSRFRPVRDRKCATAAFLASMVGFLWFFGK